MQRRMRRKRNWPHPRITRPLISRLGRWMLRNALTARRHTSVVDYGRAPFLTLEPCGAARSVLPFGDRFLLAAVLRGLGLRPYTVLPIDAGGRWVPLDGFPNRGSSLKRRPQRGGTSSDVGAAGARGLTLWIIAHSSRDTRSQCRAALHWTTVLIWMIPLRLPSTAVRGSFVVCVWLVLVLSYGLEMPARGLCGPSLRARWRFLVSLVPCKPRPGGLAWPWTFFAAFRYLFDGPAFVATTWLS